MCAVYRGAVDHSATDVYAGGLLRDPTGQNAEFLRREVGLMRAEAAGCRHRGEDDRADMLMRTADEIDRVIAEREG